MRKYLASLLVFCVILGAQSTTRAADSSQQSQQAVAVAKAYLARLKSGDAKQAVQDLWDIDAVLSASLGVTYLNLRDVDRIQAREALADLIAAPFATKPMTEMFKAVELTEIQPKVINATNVAVAMRFKAPNGHRSLTTLLLTRIGGHWWITDQMQGDQPSMRASLAVACLGASGGVAERLPAVLERAAALMRENFAKQALAAADK